MSNPYGDPSQYGENEQSEQRPQPRYGAYAPRAEGSDESEAEPPSSGGQPNPYGQPTWGQPGAGSSGAAGQPGPYASPAAGEQQGGPGQPGWQQASQQGGYPGPTVLQKPKRPITLVLSMVLMLAAGALSMVWGIYVMVTMQAQDAEDLLTDQMRDTMITSFQNDPQLQDVSPEELMEMTLTGIGVFAMIWAIVLLAVYVALAFIGTMTGNVGRILATIWLAGSLLFLLLSHDSGAFAIIAATVLASIAALVLLWLPASNEHVHRRKAFKDAQRHQQYGGGHHPYPGGQSGPGQQAPNQQGPGQQTPYSGSTNPYAG
ncbi:MAG: hypothetical protein ACTHWO_05300 [Nesterenkonia sp.]